MVGLLKIFHLWQRNILEIASKMNHKICGRKLSRNTKHRISLLRNLSKSLIRSDRIITTVAKAKELRPFVEKLITRAKCNSLHSRRLLVSKFGGSCPEISKLLSVISPKYSTRNGGYTRIIKTGFRKGDCAPMALIEFV